MQANKEIIQSIGIEFVVFLTLASIVRTHTELQVVLYITRDVYTAIMKMPTDCLRDQWVEHVYIAQLFLSAASLVRIPCNIVSPLCLI